MESVRDKTKELFSQIPARIEKLISIYPTSDSANCETIESETKETFELFSWLSFLIRDTVPTQNSTEHSVRSALMEYMMNLSGAGKALHALYDEYLCEAKFLVRHNTCSELDCEPFKITRNALGMRKQILVSHNAQVLIDIRRKVVNDPGLARILFGRAWANENCCCSN